MYSRNTDRGGKRIKLPPGYDGSAFRHDTGERRRLAEEMSMKIHSAVPEPSEREEPAQVISDGGEASALPVSLTLPAEKEKHTGGSFLEGLLTGLGTEEWLLFLLIVLLAADGGDNWDMILLLGLLLAVRER